MEENQKIVVDRFEEPHKLGIVIPCSHDSSSSSRKLGVRLIFDDYEILVYYHTNGRRKLSKRKLPKKKGLSINPFCPSCRLVIAKNFLNQYMSVGSDDYWFDKWLAALGDKVWKLVESLKQQGQIMERESSYAKLVQVRDRRLFRIASNHRVCYEEEFEACVAAGNGVFEEEIPVIEGLERLSIDDDNEFLKREDTCGICLQNLKIMDIKEAEDLKGATNDVSLRKWSKSLVKLPCDHVFHEPCVLRWLHENYVCPFCRNPVDE